MADEDAAMDAVLMLGRNTSFVLSKYTILAYTIVDNGQPAFESLNILDELNLLSDGFPLQNFVGVLQLVRDLLPSEFLDQLHKPISFPLRNPNTGEYTNFEKVQARLWHSMRSFLDLCVRIHISFNQGNILQDRFGIDDTLKLLHQDCEDIHESFENRNGIFEVPNIDEGIEQMWIRTDREEEMAAVEEEDPNAEGMNNEHSRQELNVVSFLCQNASFTFSKYCILASSINRNFFEDFRLLKGELRNPDFLYPDFGEVSHEVRMAGRLSYPMQKFSHICQLIENRIKSVHFTLERPRKLTVMDVTSGGYKADYRHRQIIHHSSRCLNAFGHLFLRIHTSFHGGTILQDYTAIQACLMDLHQECKDLDEALRLRNGEFELPQIEDAIEQIWPVFPPSVQQEMDTIFPLGQSTSYTLSHYFILASSINPDFFQELDEFKAQLTSAAAVEITSFPLKNYWRVLELVTHEINSVDFKLRAPSTFAVTDIYTGERLSHYLSRRQVIGSSKRCLKTFGDMLLRIHESFNEGNILDDYEDISKTKTVLFCECHDLMEALRSQNGEFEDRFAHIDEHIFKIWPRPPHTESARKKNCNKKDLDLIVSYTRVAAF